MAYQPIEHYGVIGDLHTVALVATNGAIDWLCLPHINSPSVFAAMLDDQKGGSWRIAPTTTYTTKQFYWPETNILITRFFASDGVAELTDFMPIGASTTTEDRHDVVRRIEVVRGTLQFEIVCAPAFNYARDVHQVDVTADGASFHTPALSLGLATTVPLHTQGTGVYGTVTLHEGESVTLVLRVLDGQNDRPTCVAESAIDDLFQATVRYWQSWLAQCTYRGRWREIVQRSALLLKLLTFAPTGAIVAAPTTSLPETLGGGRNWDYRYTWIRDAAFTLYGLLRIGFTEEAAQFMHWLEARCRELDPDGALQIVYGVDGTHTLTEETLGHLDGYRGSRPVRIGNGAYNQLQLDIYGELLDSVYLYNKYGAPISYDLWTYLRRLVNWVCDNWQRPDEGIWEVRGGQQHFVYSKLMCWVALDRALRLADKRSFPADRARWLSVRDQIYEDIMRNGWNEQLQAFTQAYGSESLDASNLLMPLVFFVSPTDPRMLATLDAINRSPKQGGWLPTAWCTATT